MSFGSGLAAIGCPPVAQLLIPQSDWRSAYAIFGTAILFVPILFLTVLLKEDPRREGLFPDGVAPVNPRWAPGSQVEGLDWYQIWPSGTFWLLITAFFLAGCGAHACVRHLAAMLSDRGFSPRDAANAVSIIGVAILFGHTGSGYFLDRFLVEVIAFLVSRYFGLRSFGLAYGFGFSSFVLAGALGTYIMGAGFDRTHSYSAPLLLVLFATILFTRLGPYRFATPSSTALRVTTPASEVAL